MTRNDQQKQASGLVGIAALSHEFKFLFNPRESLYKTMNLSPNPSMPEIDSFSLVRRLSQIGTLLHTYLRGELVGRDQFGNRYFRERGGLRPRNGSRIRQKRWVLYQGEPDPTKIPPEWHIWLHYTADAPLPEGEKKPWQKPHMRNLTGTDDAWMPPSIRGQERPLATGDYEAWTPDLNANNSRT